MEQTKIDNAFAAKYFKGGTNGKGYRCKQYWEMVDGAHHVSFHFDGYFLRPYLFRNQQDALTKLPESVNPYFEWIVAQNRPSESNTVKMIRRKAFLPKTKEVMHRVYNVLQKIVRASDWSINYPKEIDFGKDENSLEYYLEKTFPTFDSVESWYTSLALKHMLVDANSLVCVMPTEFDHADNVLCTPFPTIIKSADVYDFKDENYVVFRSQFDSIYTDGEGKQKAGIQLIIATTDAFYQVNQINNKLDFELIEVYRHDMNELPAWRIGGTIKNFAPGDIVYNSFLDPMLPDLDDMARLNSDLYAEITLNIYSTMYYYSGMTCSSCAGVGEVNVNGAKTTCTVCNGDGVMPRSPFTDFKMKLPDSFSDSGTTSIPSSPIGYVTKDTNIMTTLIDHIKDVEICALQAVNMAFLNKSPQATSGTSKSYDSDQAYNFVWRVAQHSVNNLLNPVIYFTAMMRYGQIKSKEDIESSLPMINVPTKFDIQTEEMMEQQLINLQNAKVDPSIIRQAEIEYVNKKFYNYPEIRKGLICKSAHDPFPNATLQDKLAMLQDETISKADVIQSLYIEDFCQDLVANDPNFFDMSYDEQKELFTEMTTEKMTAIDEELAAKASNPAPFPGQLPQNQQDVTPGDVPAQKVNSQTDQVRKRPFADPTTDIIGQ